MTTETDAAGLTNEQIDNAAEWLTEATASPDRTRSLANWTYVFGSRLIAALRDERRRSAALAEAAGWLIRELQAPDETYRLNEADKAMDATIAALAAFEAGR